MPTDRCPRHTTLQRRLSFSERPAALQCQGYGSSSKADRCLLGISHGVDPRDASYAYVTVMNTDEAAMQQYAQNAPVTVLQNDDRIQAVV